MNCERCSTKPAVAAALVATTSSVPGYPALTREELLCATHLREARVLDTLPLLDGERS